MTATLERRDDRGNRVAVTDLPPAGFTPADERQLRTLATSMAGALGALAAAGVTMATGGAAAAAVAAAVLVGGSAASGVHVFKTLRGFDGVAPERTSSCRSASMGSRKRNARVSSRQACWIVHTAERGMPTKSGYRDDTAGLPSTAEVLLTAATAIECQST
jgi:hypothetical protein